MITLVPASPAKTISLAFGLVASLLFIAALAMAVSTGYTLTTSLSGTGLITDIWYSYGRYGRTAHLSIKYMGPDHKEYSFSETQRSSMDQPYTFGQTVPLRVSQHPPYLARIDSWGQLWGLPAILGVVGLALATVALGFKISLMRQQRLIRHLKSSGIMLTATIRQLITNKRMRINGRSPFMLVATGLDPNGTQREFVSTSFWIKPRMPNLPLPHTVRIWSDRTNPGSYWVDLEDLANSINHQSTVSVSHLHKMENPPVL